MRTPRIRPYRRGASALFTIAFTGLSTDSIGDYAEVGDHAAIGYTIDPDNGTETAKWSNSSNPADAATYGTGASPTDYTAGDGNPLYLHVTDGGETVTRSATIRYAPGSVTETGTPFSWTIDDTTLNIDFTSDFTTTNLTGSYVIAGLPTGGVDDTDGTASGTLTGTPSSGNFTVTFTDQYGRTIVGTYAHTTVYRAQATGGADLDLSFVEDSAITPVDLAQNWTLNGNTLTYAINGTAVPPGMSVATDAELSGTPTTVTADATYTLRGTDEYGRTTDDTFTLQITELDDTAPAVASFSVGTQASDGDIPITVGAITEAGSPDDLTFGYVVTGTDQSAATPAQVKTAAEGGTPLTDQLDIGTFAITTAGGTFNEDLTSGIDDATSYVQAVVWDAAGNISTVLADGPVDIDTTAPTVSTLSPADNATDVAIDANLVMTFNEGMKRQGTVTLKNAGGATIETFDLSTDGTWSTVLETDDRITLNPTSDFTNGASLAVQWSGLEDDKGNPLANNTGDTTWNFGVAAASSFEVSWVGYEQLTYDGTALWTGTIPLGDPHPDRKLVLMIPQVSNKFPTTVTVGGIAATLVPGSESPEIGSLFKSSIWEVMVPTGTSALIECARNSNQWAFRVGVIRAINGEVSAVQVAGASTNSIDLSINTSVPGFVAAHVSTDDDAGLDMTGITVVAHDSVSAGDQPMWGLSEVLSAETPRAITVTQTNVNSMSGGSALITPVV